MPIIDVTVFTNLTCLISQEDLNPILVNIRIMVDDIAET